SGLAVAPKVASAPRGPIPATLWASSVNPCRGRSLNHGPPHNVHLNFGQHAGSNGNAYPTQLSLSPV
ncbi:MAG: hypothetical protein O3C46_03495, partial [Bacteroidetes bacterium]|nr:hypothetical protein [Bacteroidota bacterium]MDA0931619.1 hypothetical protein [Bacteroidota bacterium]